MLRVVRRGMAKALRGLADLVCRGCDEEPVGTAVPDDETLHAGESETSKIGVQPGCEEEPVAESDAGRGQDLASMVVASFQADPNPTADDLSGDTFRAASGGRSEENPRDDRLVAIWGIHNFQRISNDFLSGEIEVVQGNGDVRVPFMLFVVEMEDQDNIVVSAMIDVEIVESIEEESDFTSVCERLKNVADVLLRVLGGRKRRKRRRREE